MAPNHAVTIGQRHSDRADPVIVATGNGAVEDALSRSQVGLELGQFVQAGHIVDQDLESISAV
jgi:hypothetical protein